MEKHLKFKREWFEILNQCNADLRSDVIEAVFQYFFTGYDTHFTDDARRIAFGFIRAELDAANARRQAREAKKNPPVAVETPTETPTEAPTPRTYNKPTSAEAYSMMRVIKLWNNAVRDSVVQPINTSLHCDSPELIPLLRAIQIHSEDEIIDLIQNTDPDDFVEFDEFFENLAA